MSCTAFLRRVAAVAAAATVTLGVGPFVGSSLADPGIVSTTPANNATVGKRPAISATYGVALNPVLSNIVIAAATPGAGDPTCTRSFSVDNKTIICTLSGDLSDASDPYTVTIDAVGNNPTDGAAQTQIHLNVDSTGPVFSAPPAFSAAPVTAANQSAITINGTATDASGPIAINVSVNDTNGATPPVTASTSKASGAAFSVPVDLTGLSDGTLTATVTATDAFGNVTTASPTATKDAVGPAFVSSSPIDNSRNQPRTQVVGTFGETLGSTSSVLVLNKNGNGVSGATNVTTNAITFTADSTITETASPYTVNFVAKDLNGNQTLKTIHFVIDNTNPLAPSSVTLADPVNLANQATANVSGVAEPGSTVNISVDDTVPGNPVNDTAAADPATGAYSKNLNLTSLADGTLTATVTATDAAGNTGPSATDTATKDVVRPAVTSASMTDPVNNGNKSAVTVSGVAEPGSTVHVSVDDATPGSPVTGSTTAAAVTGNYSVPLDVTSLADGTITATVTATDAAGNTTSPAVTDTATKDAGVPAAPTVAFSPTAVNNTNKGAINVTGTADPNGSVAISVNDTDPNTSPVTQTVTATAGGAYTTSPALNLTSLSDGTLTATVHVTDAVGNQSPDGTATAAKDVGVPNAPVVNVADWINTSPLPVAGTAEAGAAIAITVTDGAAHTSTGSAVANGAGDWSTTVAITTLNEGLLTVTAKATDAVGNVSGNGSDTTTKDTVAPAAPSGTMTDPVVPANLTAVTLTGTAEPGLPMTATLNDTDPTTAAIPGSTTSDGSTGAYTIVFDATSLKDGTITAVVRATDLAGNPGATKSVSSAKDTTALALVSTSPADGVTVSAVPTVTGTYNEPVDPAHTTLVVRDSSDTSIGGATTFSGDGKTVVFTPSVPLSQAGSPYTATYDAKDAVGDHVVGTSTWTLDSSAPGTPSVAMTNPVNLANVTTIVVNGVAEPDSSVLVSVDDSNDANTSPVTQTVTAATSGGAYTATLNLTSLDDGTVTATVVASDAASNASSPGTATATKDTVAPAAPVANLPASVNAANVATTTIDGTAEAGSTIAYAVTSDGGPGTVSGTTPVSGTGDWSKSVDLTALPDGVLTLTAHVVDPSNNTGPDAHDTATKDVVTQAAPTVVLTDPVNIGNVTTATVSGVAEPGSAIAVSVDDTTIGSPVTGSGTADGTTGAYTVTVDLTSLADGALLATVVATDGAGNPSPAGTDVATKDTVAPAAPVITARTPVSHADRAAAVFAGTAEPLSSVALSVSDGTLPAVVGTAVADAQGDWTKTLDVSGLADGTLALSAVATDVNGNAGPAGTGSVMKDETRAFTIAVSATPVSGAVQPVTVTAHQTFDPLSPTDTTYVGVPVLSSLDGHFTPGTCPAAVAGVSTCDGATKFGDLGTQSLIAMEGAGDEFVSGTAPVVVQATGLVFTVAPPTIASTGEVLSFTVTPTAASGASTAGYSQTRTLVTTGGSSPATGSPLTCAAASCSSTVSFATPGTKTVQVTDDGTPNRSTPTRTITIPYVSSLSLATTRTTVVTGQSVTLFGKLKNASLNAALGGRSVRLYRRTAPATTYSLFATVTTASDGSYTKSIALTRNTAYQAKYVGDVGHMAATSIARGVLAAQKVTASYTLTGRTLVVTGSVSPLKAGAAIYIWQKRADGSIASLAKSFVSSSGSYRLSKTFVPGKYTVQVVTGSNSLNSAGFSGYRTITVT
jgi:hypothetical protein